MAGGDARVTMLDGGAFTSAVGIWREGDSLGRKARFPVPVYLVEIGAERILVDTGLHPDAAADAEAHYADNPEAMRPFELEQPTRLDAQVDLASLTGVIVTHLHFDHAGGLDLLSGSVPVYVQRREWEGGRDPEAIARNFFHPRDYEGAADQVVLVDGDHDLLGDGSLELLLTPGHPGHQSVRVGEGLVIGGDVTHFASGLDDLRLPIFGDDLEAQAASAERLRALRDAGAEVRPGHDPEVLVPGPVATD